MTNAGGMTAELERALAILESLVGEAPAYVRARLNALITELFRTVVAAVDIRRLEAGVKAQVAPDFDTIGNFIDQLSQVSPDQYEADAPDELAWITNRLPDAKALLKTTESQLSAIDPLEVGLRMELVVEPALTSAMGCCADRTHWSTHSFLLSKQS